MEKYNNDIIITDYANEMIKQYLNNKWNFNICLFTNRGNHHHSAGICYYKTNTILLNKFILDRINIDKAKLVVLHEIAHAMCNEQGDFNIGHNELWLKNNKEIGGNGIVETKNEEGIVRFQYEKDPVMFMKNLNIKKYQ